MYFRIFSGEPGATVRPPVPVNMFAGSEFAQKDHEPVIIWINSNKEEKV
jgi:hypothetical protein